MVLKDSVQYEIFYSKPLCKKTSTWEKLLGEHSLRCFKEPKTSLLQLTVYWENSCNVLLRYYVVRSRYNQPLLNILFSNLIHRGGVNEDQKWKTLLARPKV